LKATFTPGPGEASIPSYGDSELGHTEVNKGIHSTLRNVNEERAETETEGTGTTMWMLVVATVTALWA
jgi:hypothetical protein